MTYVFNRIFRLYTSPIHFTHYKEKVKYKTRYKLLIYQASIHVSGWQKPGHIEREPAAEVPWGQGTLGTKPR